MTLQLGTLLGPYEILAPLGAGGMGEVWKAKDTRLDRFVAVKVLPEHLAKHPESLARFKREAKAVAALNHSNITGIFDVGRQGDVAFLVMELLEGGSLRTHLQQGPMPVHMALEVGIQLAQGLAAAHEKGVIHRDLKPENLWLTLDGRLKILDFGLAKQITAMGPNSDSFEPTAAISPGHHTEKGIILGSLGYMSPEQVRGEIVDSRSDIFSFGVVLFEMLMGKRAFARDTASDTMAAILRDEPPYLEGTGKSIPLALRRIIDHCLEKAPPLRFHDAEDLAFTLGNARDLLFAQSPSFTPSPPQTIIRRLTHGRGMVEAARFIPGSREVVFSARWHGGDPEVYSLNPDALEPRSLGLKGASLVAVSTTGELAVKRNPRQWAYLEVGQLVRVTPGGSERIELQECLDADWLPDGSGLASIYSDVPSFWEATLDFFQSRLARCLGRAFWATRVSPQGGQLVLFEQSSPVKGDGRIVLIDREGRRTVLADLVGFTGLAWGPEGKEIWFGQHQSGSTSIWGMRPDGSKRLLMQQAGLLEVHDVSPDGKVLASLSMVSNGSMGLDAPDAGERELSWNDATETFDVSQDGTKLLLGAGGYGSSAADRRTVYLRDLKRSLTVRLGAGVSAFFTNGDRHVLTLSGLNQSVASIIPVDSGSAREVNTGGSRSLTFVLPTPQGTHAVIQDPEEWKLCDLATGHLKKFAGNDCTYFNGLNGVSPGGRSVLLGRTTGGWLDHPLFVFPIDGGEPVEVKGLQRGDIPARWTADGHSIYVFNRDGLPTYIHRIELATGERSHVRTIMPVNPSGMAGIRTLALTPDASFIAYNHTRKLSDLYLIEGLK